MEIEKLYIFPVKSLKGIEVTESPIDEYGFKYDRMYALAYPEKDGHYSVLTQRKLPSLARINVQIKGETLILSFDDDGQHHEISVPANLQDLPSDLPGLSMELWGFDMVCGDLGAKRPDLVEFFAKFLADESKFKGTTLIASKQRRPVPTAGPDTDSFVAEAGRSFESSFQDLFPGTIMATASFAELEERVEMQGGGPIQARSFRMNMVVKTDDPWVEDDWKRLRIGGHEWFVDRLCERCSMPAVDQDLGVTRATRQPLPELNRFRIIEKGKTPCFGLNLFNKDKSYTMRVGDPVEVLQTQD